ncbi:MAG: hypothetical protein KDA24_28635 [Deltaproteobacteria bacterium]|nr:hypothetical protein [Deltaproteobacteria bacterium]
MTVRLPALPVVLTVLCAPSLGHTAPQFDAYDQDVGALAKEVWRAGVECTGWEPAHSPIVDIAETDLGWANGTATWAPDVGLRSIALSAPPESDSGGALAHEVAHAWAHSRTSALSEGVAQVLEACIAERLGLHAGTGPSLPDALIDLRTWSARDSSDAERLAGYELARRLARTRLLLFGGDAVWGPEAPTNLAQLRLDLLGRGTEGRLLDSLLDRPAALRVFLRDQDHDDVPDGVERLLDTDPERWDTDDDGWWDGAAVTTRHGVPIPSTLVPVCLPPSDGWRLQDSPLSWSRGLEQWIGGEWVPWQPVDGWLPPARVVRRAADDLYWSGWGGRGGSWLLAKGPLQSAEAVCVEGGRQWVALGGLVVAEDQVTPG